MKNIKFLFAALVLVLFVTSCEKYDDYDANRPEIAGFTSAAKNLKVPSGRTKDLALDVYVTNVTDEDRTFTVSVVDFRTTVAAENYQLGESVTIPAGEHIGTFTVTGVDASLTEEKLDLVLKVNPEGNVISGGQVTVKLYK